MERFKRRPWGLRGWLFWVIAVVAAGIVGNIPAIGEALLVAVLIAAAVVWFRTPRTDAWSYMPVPITGDVPAPIVDGQEVVGESFRHDALYRFVTEHGREAPAVLTWEPGNKHSAGRTAVRVDLLTPGGEPVHCGYIPELSSAAVSAMVKANSDQGLRSVARAKVFGGEGPRQNLGVWLYR